MPEENFLLFKAISKDGRYPIDAYQFVREAAAFADDVAELGDYSYEHRKIDPSFLDRTDERHLTGQQLCEAIRLYAMNQFGYMARVVLKNWHIESTSAFGDIVYNMIEVGIMKKSRLDRKSHFDDVYDFNVFDTEFEICNSVAARRV